MTTRCYFCRAWEAAGHTFFPLCGACAGRVTAQAQAEAACAAARRRPARPGAVSTRGALEIDPGLRNALPAPTGRG
jgi:hypothetical protein